MRETCMGALLQAFGCLPSYWVPSMTALACLSHLPTCLPSSFSPLTLLSSSPPVTHKSKHPNGDHEFIFSCTKRRLLRGSLGALVGFLSPSCIMDAHAQDRGPQFYELENSGGVKVLDIKEGTGETPQLGYKVAIHYYARLAAKQGWRFDSTYDHKDETGAPQPYVFTLGAGTVIAGLDMAVRTMKEGGVRRVIIPPSQGYLNTSQGPIPPNFFDRQRLYTTIFNPTRLANGEGSTLGTLIFDIELLRIRPS